jgi:hypothetical protein
MDKPFDAEKGDEFNDTLLSVIISNFHYVTMFWFDKVNISLVILLVI